MAAKKVRREHVITSANAHVKQDNAKKIMAKVLVVLDRAVDSSSPSSLVSACMRACVRARVVATEEAATSIKLANE